MPTPFALKTPPNKWDVDSIKTIIYTSSHYAVPLIVGGRYAFPTPQHIYNESRRVNNI